MLLPEDKKEVQKMIDSSSKGEFDKRIGDTPTDDLQLVNRRYVNSYGTTANRPTNRTPAQKYFDTTIGRPVYFNPNSSVWTDGAGSVS